VSLSCVVDFDDRGVIIKACTNATKVRTSAVLDGDNDDAHCNTPNKGHPSVCGMICVTLHHNQVCNEEEVKAESSSTGDNDNDCNVKTVSQSKSNPVKPKIFPRWLLLLLRRLLL
jgi:hypothetical protein